MKMVDNGDLNIVTTNPTQWNWSRVGLKQKLENLFETRVSGIHVHKSSGFLLVVLPG